MFVPPKLKNSYDTNEHTDKLETDSERDPQRKKDLWLVRGKEERDGLGVSD